MNVIKALPPGAVGWSAVYDCVFFPDHTHLLFSARKRLIVSITKTTRL